MIKYIGSKRELIPLIESVVRAFPDARSVLDMFSGTSRVGYALKQLGYRVIANDHNAYAHALATCYVQADAEDWEADAARLIQELNSLPGVDGFFTEHFCIQSRYVQPKNGRRIDAIRAHIARLGLHPELDRILISSLLEAADRVDSTAGVQMAYLKQWSKRSHNDLELRPPSLLRGSPWGKGQAHRMDAIEAASKLEADIAYLDPPYNQHSYVGNYHVWETLATGDEPALYGIARKREDVRDRRSAFNSKTQFRSTMEQLLATIQAPTIIVSFSNEGFCTRAELVEMLSSRGQVAIIARPFKRYVGARIGIYNNLGAKVGKVGKLDNTEHLFVCSNELPEAIRELAAEPALSLQN